VNAIFCNYCRKNGHKTKICRKKKRDENNKKRKTSSGSSEYSSEDFSDKRRNFPCCICDAKDDRSHECPRLAEVRKCLADSDCSADRKTPVWGRDETYDDEDA
jgi:hypothetical protein